MTTMCFVINNISTSQTLIFWETGKVITGRYPPQNIKLSHYLYDVIPQVQRFYRKPD